MKISYKWLKNYITTDLSPEQIAEKLTECGLEVESVDKHESIKGGLNGVVIGEVLTKERIPDTEKLSITTVNVGNGEPLSIVCGASNVAAGQKVLVATVGTILHMNDGKSLEIKKSKIRGQLSEGMICAEDELGLGSNHEGIMVLPPDVKPGTLAAEYFSLTDDFVFEIGLTPNRADAASHIGVARDLVATINCEHSKHDSVILPDVSQFKVDDHQLKIDVIIEDPANCPRYSGITISGVTVKESPDWIKEKLKAIGLKPINNIVDITNYVLHETGQPLHAFDADTIKGRRVIVKKATEGQKFITLDNVERTLSSSNLMICNESEPMVIAGVFGGLKSGVTESTKNIFIESAYFNPVSIRKTSKFHGLKTDASFRYERGADPEITVYALKRACLLIQEIAGGKISSDIIDVYPEKIKPVSFEFKYEQLSRLGGINIDPSIVKNILTSLAIKIDGEDSSGLRLTVPAFKVDVTRPVDIVEEVLRIYGYNKVQTPEFLRTSITFTKGKNKERIQQVITSVLNGLGFSELWNNSLTSSSYLPEDEKSKAVHLLNPLSSDLDILRTSLLYGNLQNAAYNINRQSKSLKLFEFGKIYFRKSDTIASVQDFNESAQLSLLTTGRKFPVTWNNPSENTDLYQIKNAVKNILEKFGIDYTEKLMNDDSSAFSNAVGIYLKKSMLGIVGQVKKGVLKQFDIDQPVFWANLNWDNIIEAYSEKIEYKEVSKFPRVERDLSMLLESAVEYSQIKKLAFETERNLLKDVNIFDVYQGDKLEAGKKSYAITFVLQDENNTLNDKQIEKVMEKLQLSFEKNLGAQIRK